MYEVAPSADGFGYVVEAWDMTTGEGEIVIFYGADAKLQAEEYAEFQNAQ